MRGRIAREAARLVGVEGPLEITVAADLPHGTGLGSSSSLTIGLLVALHRHRGTWVAPGSLADQACRIEVERLGRPIGFQDQYIIAYGGLNCIEFHADGTVDVEQVCPPPGVLATLEKHMFLIYIGSRDGDAILRRQSATLPGHHDTLRAMTRLAQDMRDALINGHVSTFEKMLCKSWELKQSLDPDISNSKIDEWYGIARGEGAVAGKVLGAGGGGFLLLAAPPSRREAILKALGRPPAIPLRFGRSKSRIILDKGGKVHL